ncbi:hypothetical protein CVU82_01825 [Candidatus Falkowbacteria bacterium HGW-Falkowbacteria-1]|uniref:Uncharacterized protein n=1 Tax=Candidatus Falkowbacteria bacterium HGW-Falkowbacteria-1 TaxID=2013768 RepID=A0A2N2E9E8_9BACT|nr:MAG: hypothetical protein CVU82_01825 [Candidatus Falkowbacteria bacterium HGW-Falkowbacteria-1]
MDNTPTLTQSFIEEQKEKILGLLKEYNDPEKIKEALEGEKTNPEDGESPYMVYIREKQKNVVPILKTALEMIKLDRYGICLICGREIEMARLKSFPGATKCCQCMNINVKK